MAHCPRGNVEAIHAWLDRFVTNLETLGRHRMSRVLGRLPPDLDVRFDFRLRRREPQLSLAAGRFGVQWGCSARRL